MLTDSMTQKPTSLFLCISQAGEVFSRIGAGAPVLGLGPWGAHQRSLEGGDLHALHHGRRAWPHLHHVRKSQRPAECSSLGGCAHEQTHAPHPDPKAPECNHTTAAGKSAFFFVSVGDSALCHSAGAFKLSISVIQRFFLLQREARDMVSKPQ